MNLHRQCESDGTIASRPHPCPTTVVVATRVAGSLVCRVANALLPGGRRYPRPHCLQRRAPQWYKEPDNTPLSGDGV